MGLAGALQEQEQIYKMQVTSCTPLSITVVGCGGELLAEQLIESQADGDVDLDFDSGGFDARVAGTHGVELDPVAVAYVAAALGLRPTRR